MTCEVRPTAHDARSLVALVAGGYGNTGVKLRGQAQVIGEPGMPGKSGENCGEGPTNLLLGWEETW